MGVQSMGWLGLSHDHELRFPAMLFFGVSQGTVPSPLFTPLSASLLSRPA